MKGGRILLEVYTLEQLVEALRPLVQPNAPVQPTTTEDNLLSRDEVCALLNISKTTLNTRTKDGKLKSYAIGNRVLYKRSEVLAALCPINH